MSWKRWRRRRAEACRGRRGRFQRQRERLVRLIVADFVRLRGVALDFKLAMERWTARGRAARRGENAETPGPRLADLEREVVRELNGRK